MLDSSTSLKRPGGSLCVECRNRGWHRPVHGHRQAQEHHYRDAVQRPERDLQQELDHLRGPVRTEIVQRISSAREEGDLKENGGYHAAREEQGKTEARIRQLEDMLRRAEVGETPPDDGVVEPGMKVTTRFVGDTETEVFLLGATVVPAGAMTLTRIL